MLAARHAGGAVGTGLHAAECIRITPGSCRGASDGIPLPSTGSPRQDFSGFSGTTEMLQDPAASPTELPLRPAVPPLALLVLLPPAAKLPPPAGQELFFLRCSPDSLGWKRQGVPGSWETPMPACPALRPRWNLSARLSSAPRCCLPRKRDGVGFHHRSHFGAQSRSLRARCLRLAARLSPQPRKTRFRLAANLCRAGTLTRRASQEGSKMSSAFYISSSFSRLILAHRAAQARSDALRGKPRRHGQEGGEQFADQNEDERDVEQARGRLIGSHVGRLPDEIGERERSHDPPEDPEEKKERVPLQRQERRESLSSGRDHDRDGEQRGAAEGERREKRRPAREQPKRERARDQIPVAEVHRQEDRSKE